MQRNRRLFSRVPFHAEGRLSQSSQECDVEVLDLSLKGALLRLPSDFFVTVGHSAVLRFRLDELGTLVTMSVTVVHRQGDRCGLACRDIDLDSATLLRRIVELNLGDQTTLQRELSVLVGR